MEGAPFNGMFVSNKAKAFTVEIFYHHPCPSTTSRKEPLLIGWSPPSTGFVKLNSEGSALGNPGSAGAGGVYGIALASGLVVLPPILASLLPL